MGGDGPLQSFRSRIAVTYNEADLDDRAIHDRAPRLLYRVRFG